MSLLKAKSPSVISNVLTTEFASKDFEPGQPLSIHFPTTSRTIADAPKDSTEINAKLMGDNAGRRIVLMVVSVWRLSKMMDRPLITVTVPQQLMTKAEDMLADTAKSNRLPDAPTMIL